jgi:hypothetical protein
MRFADQNKKQQEATASYGLPNRRKEQRMDALNPYFGSYPGGTPYK